MCCCTRRWSTRPAPTPRAGRAWTSRRCWPREKPYVQGADLGICHLETPLAPADGPFSGYPEFSVPPQVLPALVATGYDACSTASNHTLDQGTDGVNRTLDDLDAAGLAHDGSYRTAQDAATPTILTTPHGKVGFISVTYGFNDGPPDQPWQVNVLDTDAILAKAHAARAAGADLVVVAVHAGTEYDTEPNSDQVTAARTLLASPDIDLVYGHHAHVVQPLQKINGKWVIYGLGNNIAAQETPVEGTHRGLLVRVTFSQDSTGAWTTSDIAWVPSLQDADPPHRWCSLTAGATCSLTGRRRRRARRHHRGGQPLRRRHRRRPPAGKALSRRSVSPPPELATPPSVAEPRPSGLGTFETSHNPNRDRRVNDSIRWPSRP